MDDLSIDVLVNKENMLSIDYIPKNMYIVDNNDNNFHNYLIDNMDKSQTESNLSSNISYDRNDEIGILVKTIY